MAAASALLALGGVLVNPAPALASPLGSPATAQAVAGRRLIVVTWTAPTSPGGTVARYRATATGSGGQSCDLLGPSFPAQLTCTITALTANTSYAVTVVACPNISTSDATDCSAPTSAGSVTPGPPAAPTKPTVAYQGDPNTMRVSWTPQDPGPGISSYKVTPTPTPANASGTCTGLINYPTNTCDISGLDSGVAYTFRVTAIGITNAAGSSGSSTLSPASTAKIAGVPAAPDQPTVTRDSDTGVTVSWTPPVGGPVITEYDVSKTVDGVTSSACLPVIPDDSSCAVTGLDMTKSYTFTVKSVGETGGGVSVASPASAPIIPGFPGKPDAPSVELGDSAGKVTVYWDPPADGGTVASYVVTPSPQTTNVTPQTCTTGPGTTYCAFQGLDNGQAYTFTVRAHNAAGDQVSAPSAPIISQLPNKPATPVVTLGDAVGKVNLTWTPATGGGTVTNYVVTAIPAGGGGTGTQDANCGANLASPSCTITGLTAGDSYTFTVTAVGDLGGVASDPSASIIPNKPGTPAGVGVTLAGSPVVATVNWTVPTTGGGVVTGYKVVVTSTDGGTLPNPCEVGPTVSHCDFPGLDGAKHYQFTVSAKNAAGETAASATPAIVPSKPGAPTGVTVTITSPGHVTVGWTPPTGAAVTGYSVAATSTDQAANVSAGCTGGSGATSCTIGDLSTDKPYTFVVTATNSLGPTSANATPPIVAAAVQAPTAVTALPGASAGTATVTWTAPALGGTVTDYTVTTATTDGGALPTPNPCVVPAGTTTCAISGLDAAKHYNFTVAARNDLGSQPAAATTPDLVPDKPGVPTGVGVALKANTPGAVIVSWTAPTDRGAPTGFEVTTSSTDGGALPTPNPCVAGPSATSCEISGLNQTKNYQFVVSAKNPAGHSEAAATTALVPDKPAAPTAPTVDLGNANGKVTVSWVAPTGGGAVTGYQVIASSTNGGTTTPTCTGGAGATSCSITGLDADKQYTFTVQALNAAGTANSVATGAIVPGPSPTPINMQVLVSPTPGTVTVNWDEPAGGVVTLYTVTPTTGGSAGTPCTVASPLPRTCTFTNLDVTKTYTFTVKAENALGGNTTLASGPVIANKPNAPGAPKAEITAADLSGATVKVTWFPSPPGAGPVADYTVTAFASDAPLTPVNVDNCTHVNGLTCNFSGLNVTKAYNFVVTANGSAGATADSQPSELVDMAAPGATSAPAVALGGANGVRVSWTKPLTGGPVLSFSVTSSPAVETPAACSSTQRMSCLFTGLVSGTSYTFAVTAEGTAGRTAVSPNSAPIVVGPPDVPTRPTVAPGASSDQVVVSWEPSSPGAGIAGYAVESVPGRIGCAGPAGPAATSCVVAGLTPATTYTFRVQAVGVVGSGSSAFSRVSEPIVPQAPGRPYDIDVVAGNRQIAVSWTPPATTDRVASYRAMASPGGATCTTTGTECIITGLTNLKSYTVSVVAVGVTGLGESPASLPSNRVRPSAGRPGTPTAVQVTPGDGKAVISWTAPADPGDGIARYSVSVNGGDAGNQTCLTDNGTILTCTVTGLTNLAKYTVTVTSIGKAASGNSAPSAPIDLVPNVAPGTPTGVSVTPGDKTLVVNWTPGTDGSGVSGVTATATGGTTPLTCTTTGNTATTCTISTNVVPGTTYAVTVVANSVVTGVTSPPTAPVSAMALLAVPVPVPTTSAAPTSAGALTASATSVKVDGTLTVTGTGYAPYTGIAVGIYPNGVPLATAVTDSTGKFTATVKVSGATGSRVIAAGGVLSTGPGVKYKTVTVTVS
ncbi:fibronectin type III domain-containing protein [Actinoplanes subtropicus]|uniref:fibronectin type III domain-containing protein n=1 Tax=Actinoplanes subtropicus TaxID=543632 RepID=UPI0004C42A52|nr:fibronectin type III domain-containing protein [Actinoplanes subtropicus]